MIAIRFIEGTEYVRANFSLSFVTDAGQKYEVARSPHSTN